MPLPDVVRQKYEVIPYRDVPGHWGQLTTRAQAFLGLGREFRQTKDHPAYLPSSLVFREVLSRERKRGVFRDRSLLVVGVGDARDVISTGKVKEIFAVDIKQWKLDSVHFNLTRDWRFRNVPITTLHGDAIDILNDWAESGETFNGRVLIDLPQEPRRSDAGATHYDEVGLGLQSDALKALHQIATPSVIVYLRLDDRTEEQDEPLTVFDELGWDAERVICSLVPQDPDVRQIEWMKGKIPDREGLFYNNFMEPMRIADAIEITRMVEHQSLDAETPFNPLQARVFHTASVYKLRKK